MLYEYQTQPLLDKLRAGDIELGILALPVRARWPGDARALSTRTSRSRCRASIRWRRRMHIKLDDLTGENLLLLEDGHCLRDQALDVCSRVDVKENDDYRATSLETLRQMVAAGLGITLLPELATRGPFGSRSWPDGEDRSRNRFPRARSAPCGARAVRARQRSRRSARTIRSCHGRSEMRLLGDRKPQAGSCSRWVCWSRDARIRALYRFIDAKAVATPPGAAAGAVYLELVSASDDELLAVTTPVAERAEMHSSTTSNGMMQMRPVAKRCAQGRTDRCDSSGRHASDVDESSRAR